MCFHFSISTTELKLKIVLHLHVKMLVFTVLQNVKGEKKVPTSEMHKARMYIHSIHNTTLLLREEWKLGQAAHKAPLHSPVRCTVGVDLHVEPAGILVQVRHELRHCGVATWRHHIAGIHRPVCGLLHRAQARRNCYSPGQVRQGHDSGAALAHRCGSANSERDGIQERQLQNLHVQAHVENIVGVSAGV